MLNQNGGIIGPANIPTTTSAKGKWSLAEYYLAKRQNIWPSVTPNEDPYFEYTTLLLPGNGTDGANNNTFLDSGTANSGSGFTITRNGNTTQGTFSPFSQTGWGNYFNGSSGFAYADNTNLEPGSGDFTLEVWVFHTAAIGSESFYYYQPSSGIGISRNASGKVQINQSGIATILTSTGSVNSNQWVHVAVVRSGSGSNNLKVYIDGNADATTATSTTNFAGTGSIDVGKAASGSYMTGYFSNLRFCKAAVYTSNFTPSTSPLTTTSQGASNCNLLICQSNRFKDNSSNDFSPTISGSPSVQAFSPFNPTASWSATTNGGSGYFDGNADYLRAGSAADWTFLSNTTAAWTVEFWIYNTTSGSATVLFDTANSTTANVGVAIQKTSSEYVNVQIVYASAGNFIVNGTSTSTLTANTWNHVFISYNQSLASSNLVFYINGVSAGTANKTANTPSSSNPFGALSIGTYGAGSGAFFTGYLSNVRISNVVRTPPSSVPTSPYTSDTDTKLLLNFTNAGIYDATSKNDLETLDNTVNGVRISTTQSKFGGSSIYFDGTGTDYLWIQADQPIQRFGTAPFTIEMWIRLAALGSARGLVAKGTSTTGWLVSLNTSNQVVFTYGTSTITSTGTISQNAWTYIAVVREGTSTNQTKIYIGGVNDGTGTVSTDFTQTSSMYIGANRTGGDLYSGYIQDVRITNGYARTVTTVPTSAFSPL